MPRDLPGSPASVALLWQLNMLGDTVGMVQRARGADGGENPRKRRGDTGQGDDHFFLVSFLALFSKEKAPWRSARCHTEILGCSLQACVAAFPAPLGGGPVSQGTS